MNMVYKRKKGLARHISMLLKHIVMYLFYLFYDVNSGFIKKFSVESFSAVNYFLQILF